jgi:hypothetical protein
MRRLWPSRIFLLRAIEEKQWPRKAKTWLIGPNVMEGATSKRAMRIRISMIARERGLSDEEIAEAMNCGTEAILDFAEKHDLSLDWLCMGDHKGLLRTVRWKQQHD